MSCAEVCVETRINITMDGRNIPAKPGQTILEVARENGIYIPTLCHDDQLKPFGSCWICVVEVEKAKGFVPACATRVTEGMVIQTMSPKIALARRTCLELLLSDHYGDCLAPCKLTCPAGIDIQGYIALIADGQYREAVELIKKSNPLPAICGRVCPHPCESECRRNLVDEPVAINFLKRFAADYDLNSYDLNRNDRCVPPAAPKTGNKVAVIGSGPAGLSASYYLARMGHEVTIFEALPEPGGMLRYGIPEYRLPKNLLDREIATITDLGVTIETGKALGKDFTIADLFKKGFNAVFLAIGAHRSQKMNVEGENLEGVMTGIEFLRSLGLGAPAKTGRRVAVVGGGNTAIDAARTSLRLGAGEVMIVYRRGREEMPANDIEVEEAELEGVKFHFLAAPVRVIGEGGKAKAIECIKMALGKPDESGRRRPEPVPGSEFLIDVDTVIVAIGQTAGLSCLGNEAELSNEAKSDPKRIKYSRRGNLLVDAGSYMTDMEGVFAGGDAVSGAATAIEGIAAGRKAALAIDRYVKRLPQEALREPFNSKKGKLHELDKGDFVHIERKPRQVMPMLPLEARKHNFNEVELGFTRELAKNEADRCLACGCKEVFGCTLRQLATEYEASISRFLGETHHYTIDESHPFIIRDPNKCILCGRCVRVCVEVQGIGALGFVYRGFNAIILPSFAEPLQDTECNACGQCITACPTGALSAKPLAGKAGPWETAKVTTVCTYCGAGCNLDLNVAGNRVTRVTASADTAPDRRNLCVKGHFGYAFIHDKDRLTTPLIKKGNTFVETTFEEAIRAIAKGFGRVKEKHGADALAVFASPRCTNEESYLAQKLARAALGTRNVAGFGAAHEVPAAQGLAAAFGLGASTNSFDEISQADLILIVGADLTEEHPVVGLKVRKAIENGTRLIVIDGRETTLAGLATTWLRAEGVHVSDVITSMVNVIIERGWQNSDFLDRRVNGYAEFASAVKAHDHTPEMVAQKSGLAAEASGVAKAIVEAAQAYARARNPMIIFGTETSPNTENGFALSSSLANLALVTGNVGRPSTGIIFLRGKNNAQGAMDMGVMPGLYPAGRFFDGKIKAAFIIGEDPAGTAATGPEAAATALKGLEFLVVQDLFLTETAKQADVVLPAASFAETEGTFTNSERRIQRVRRAIKPLSGLDNWQIICEISKALGYSMDYRSADDVLAEAVSLTPRPFLAPSRETGVLATDMPIPGVPILYEQGFARPGGRAELIPPEPEKPREKSPDGKEAGQEANFTDHCDIVEFKFRQLLRDLGL